MKPRTTAWLLLAGFPAAAQTTLTVPNTPPPVRVPAPPTPECAIPLIEVPVDPNVDPKMPIKPPASQPNSQDPLVKSPTIPSCGEKPQPAPAKPASPPEPQRR